MRPNGVHHVAMSAPSLDAARAFYVDLMGLKEVFDMTWSGSPGMDTITALKGSAGKMMFLDAGNVLLEIYEFTSPTPEHVRPRGVRHNFGYPHICFGVDDAVAEYERLSAAGIKFLSPPQNSPN